MESSEGDHDIETRKKPRLRYIVAQPILSKVLEKILLKRLVPIIDEHINSALERVTERLNKYID
jgi:hypothetical protein